MAELTVFKPFDPIKEANRSAWETRWTSHCDQAGCDASIVIMALNKEEAIARTKDKGWEVTKGHNAFCPKHKSKKGPSTDGDGK